MCFAAARRSKLSIASPRFRCLGPAASVPLDGKRETGDGKIPVGRVLVRRRRSRGLIGAWASLASLFGASFLASTLIPISSEAALFAVLRLHADLAWPALAVATLGNTLGGLTTYSTFEIETRRLLDTGHAGQALLYVALTIVGGMMAIEIARGDWSRS